MDDTRASAHHQNHRDQYCHSVFAMGVPPFTRAFNRWNRHHPRTQQRHPALRDHCDLIRYRMLFADMYSI